MKIGVLTYHRSHNYGALLQAIALRNYLVDMGHQVSFIDYWPNYHRHMYALFSLQYLMNIYSKRDKLVYLKNCIVHYSVRKQRKENFELFISEYICPFVSSLEDQYDLIIHGSDQIWRKQPEIKTYNPIYFGKHSIKTKKRASYAASMGVLPHMDYDKKVIEKYLHNLDYISVRESELCDLIKSMDFTCQQHLDPTFLFNGINWAKMMRIECKQDDKYVLFYHLLPNSFDTNLIKRFATEKGLKVKILYNQAIVKNSENIITTADPIMFLKLVYNADFVFSSSFHGLVFSLLFHKNFYVAFSTNSGRAKSLLRALNLEDRLLVPLANALPTLNAIDYNKIEGRLNMLRQSSYNYLKEITSEKKDSENINSNAF